MEDHGNWLKISLADVCRLGHEKQEQQIFVIDEAPKRLQLNGFSLFEVDF